MTMSVSIRERWWVGKQLYPFTLDLILALGVLDRGFFFNHDQ